MSVLDAKKKFKTALQLRYSGSHKAKWWLNDENMLATAKFCESIIMQNSGLSSEDNIEILKEEANRFVFRSELSANEKCVVKVFPLQCLRHRLKYHWMKYRNQRFAFGEAVSLLMASERGLKVPKVYGYGQIYDSSMLIKKSVLILEDLDNHITIGDKLALNKDDENKCLEILDRAIPLLVSLYKVGCNHISVNSGCIMLNKEDCQEDDFILDFEYASFFDKPSLELLMFESAILAKYCKALISNETIAKWVSNILDAVEIIDPLSRDSLIERFYFHFNTQISRKERQKIGTPGS